MYVFNCSNFINFRHLLSVVMTQCFLVLHSPGHIIFRHHFRDLLIPNFMVVTILILLGNIILNHILLCLASFDYSCGSFAVYRIQVLFPSGAVQAIQHILWTHLFLAIFKVDFLQEKHTSLVLSTVMCNDQKSNMSPANQAEESLSCAVFAARFSTVPVITAQPFLLFCILHPLLLIIEQLFFLYLQFFFLYKNRLAPILQLL